MFCWYIRVLNTHANILLTSARHIRALRSYRAWRGDLLRGRHQRVLSLHEEYKGHIRKNASLHAYEHQKNTSRTNKAPLNRGTPFVSLMRLKKQSVRLFCSYAPAYMKVRCGVSVRVFDKCIWRTKVAYVILDKQLRDINVNIKATSRNFLTELPFKWARKSISTPSGSSRRAHISGMASRARSFPTFRISCSCSLRILITTTYDNGICECACVCACVWIFRAPLFWTTSLTTPACVHLSDCHQAPQW